MKKQKEKTGQSFLEFSFALMMVVLLMVGMIKVFLWTGRDLVARRQAHERVLLAPCGDEGLAACPLRQMRPTFYTADEINAAVNSSIFGSSF